jgi:molecular chaperone DnaJ
MQLKDYYKTLNVSSTATIQQIKKSFRMLALQFHPDKNPGNVYAEAQFREVQEAYEILSDAKKREEYNYKRWYTKSLGKQFKTAPTTPAAILAECERLDNYLAGINIFQVDFDGLSYHIRQILSDTNIGILRQFNDISINQQVVQKTLHCSIALPLIYTAPITGLLIRIAGNNKEMNENINLFTKQQLQKDRWHKYKILSVIMITLFICWLIYMLSR